MNSQNKKEFLMKAYDSGAISVFEEFDEHYVKPLEERVKHLEDTLENSLIKLSSEEIHVLAAFHYDRYIDKGPEWITLHEMSKDYKGLEDIFIPFLISEGLVYEDMNFSLYPSLKSFKEYLDTSLKKELRGGNLQTIVRWSKEGRKMLFREVADTLSIYPTIYEDTLKRFGASDV